MTKYIIVCNRLGRLTVNSFYNQKQFSRGDSVKKVSFRRYFVAEDFHYDLYNTLEFIKKLKSDSEKGLTVSTVASPTDELQAESVG